MNDTRLEMLYAQLHTLLDAGLDFSQTFALLTGGERDAPTRRLLEELYRRVVGGEGLHRALELSGRFRALDCGVVRIGEATGRLTDALAFLRDHYARRTAARKSLSAALTYPAVVMATAVATVAFMLAVIVPMFEAVYARMGGELPALTRSVIAFSQGLPRRLFVLLVAVGAVGLLLWRHRRDERLEARVGAMWLALPGVGGLVRLHHQSHICKLLHLLTISGVPLLEGVDMLTGVVRFQPYRASLRAVAVDLEQGALLSAALTRTPGLYDRKLVALLRVGEETNRLPAMLAREGERLSGELEHRLKRLGALAEPVLILGVGALVAVVLVAMYLPMFRLGGAMGA